MTNLETQLNKIVSFSDYYLSTLREFTEGDWFEPTNQNSEAFSVCDLLADKHLIVKRKSPVWRNGSFKGTRIAFLYKEDLNYQPKDLSTV